jgi:mono/diheme cytochrome c family protein
MSMPRGRSLAFVLVAAAVLLLGGSAVWLGARESKRTFREPDLPESYRLLRNPFEGSAEAVAAGAKLFGTACATCHGSGADGNGKSAAGMDPKPANFREGPVLREHSDAWLFWRVSEGKKKSAMPSWRGSLSEDERWQLVTYLRSLEGK